METTARFAGRLIRSAAMQRVACGRCGWTACVALTIALLARTAHASDDGLIRARLRVEPGATCLTAEGLAAEIEPLLDEPTIPGDVMFVVEGSVIDARSARLRVVRGERAIAERAFQPGPERCDHFHAALGLAIALAINAAQEEERAETREWSAAATGLWTYRLLPQLAPGAELLARRGFGEHALLRAGVAAAFAFDQTLGSQGTFDAALLVARIDGCARTRLSEGLRADGCAGLWGGVLDVSGNDVASATSSAVPWLALAVAGALELALSDRWALSLGISGHFLLHRVEVGLENAGGLRAESRALDRFGLALAIGPVYYFRYMRFGRQGSARPRE